MDDSRMSVGNDGMVKIVSLYSIFFMFCLVSLDDGERTKFLIYLLFSLALV